MLKRFILASVGFLLAANANAADGAYSWQGAYVGGQIGASWGKGEYEAYEINKESKTYNQYIWDGQKYIYQPYQYIYLTYDKRNQKFDNSVFVGGIYLGYNFQIKDRFIFGVEADVAWGGDKQNSYSENSFNNRLYNYGYYSNGTTNTSYSDYYRFSSLNSEIKSQYNGAFRTRFGYTMDRFLPYVAVGLAFTKVTYTEFGQNVYAYNYVPDHYGNSNNFYSNYTNTASKTMTGYTLGLGTDYALTDNILLRTEYRYTDFGSVDISPYSAEGEGAYRIKYKSHDVRFGVAYKF